MKWAARLWGVALCVTALASAQDGLVIRTETRLVLVDAVVRDKAGRIVRDLGAKDFQLFEDGKEQTISSFQLTTPDSPEAQAQPQYILFLFKSAMPNWEQVESFIASYARPGHYVAAAAYPSQLDMIQNFTDSPERFLQSMMYYQPKMDVRPSGDPFYLRRQPEIRPTWIISALRDLAKGVLGIRGRKTVVVLDPERLALTDISRAADDCNKADLGVFATSPDLRELAKRTGGRILDVSDLSRELIDIASEQDEHYVLGYAPRDSPEGSCHSLRVRVGRENLDTRARQRYCTVKPPNYISSKVIGKAMEAHVSTAGTISASVGLPYFYVAPGVALIDLAMETTPLDLKFEKVNGKRHAELDVLGQTLTPDGSQAGRFSETVKFDFATDQELEAFRKQPYRYRHQFRLAAGHYRIRIAFGVGERVLGKVEAPLTIDPWDGKQLAVSGIAISRQGRAVPDLASDLDASLLAGQKPLIADLWELLPSGDSRCWRTEPCYAYLELNGASLTASDAVPPKATIRVLDKASGSQVSSGNFDLAGHLHAGSSVVPVILQLPVKDLRAGSYTFEFLAASGSYTAVRRVDFDVE